MINKRKDLIGTKIETDFLLLVPICLKFQQQIFKEFTPTITTFMYPRPAKHISETVIFIKESLKGLRAGSNLQLVIVSKQSKQFLGCAGLHNIDTKTPEMGVWIKLSAQGYAYGRQAMTAIKDWADKNLKYDYLLYPVADKNIASRKIPELLGGKIYRQYDKKNMSGKNLHILEYRIYPQK